MSNIPAKLSRAYQIALAAYCDQPRSALTLERLTRVQGLQIRAAKHYGVPTLKGPRA